MEVSEPRSDLKIQNVLAIETSCDDTSVAVVRADGYVRHVISANQNRAHEVFGGIVPEIAGRNHTYHLVPLIQACLDACGFSFDGGTNRIDGIAVTSKPGLIGSLMVGLVTAKSLALAHAKPFIGVNHLEGHLLAPFLKDDDYNPPTDFDYPYAALAISGGHTSLYRIDGLGKYEVLGQTIDDAAGEAFDKFGKMIGLGFPGGVRVDRHSVFGQTDRFNFPRSMIREDHLNFSFSGLKSSARRAIDQLSAEDAATLKDDLVNEPRAGILADLCASFQDAIVDVLLDRLDKAVSRESLTRAVLTGGVSANSRLRERGRLWAKARSVEIVIPPLRYCTDNAAMIGYAGIQRMNAGESSPLTLGPEPRAPLGTAPLPQNLPEWLKRAKGKGPK